MKEILVIVGQLLSATSGLTYFSESDEPYEVFVHPLVIDSDGGPLTVDDCREMFGFNDEDNIRELNYVDFVNRLLTRSSNLMFANANYDLAETFQLVFEEKLANTRVFKINDGKVRVTYIIVGVFERETLIGLRFVGTET